MPFCNRFFKHQKANIFILVLLFFVVPILLYKSLQDSSLASLRGKGQVNDDFLERDDDKCGALRSEEESLNTLDPSRGLLDASRTFKTHPFVSLGKQWTLLRKTWYVCLSTQTSADHLFWVGQQAKMWTGPMSVAVFAPGADYTVVMIMIMLLQKCFPEVRDRVSFHISYPKVLLPQLERVGEDMLQDFQCELLEYVNKDLVNNIRSEKLKKILKDSHYPQNHLRNLARKGCDSPYTFTPDVDMISIPGMSEELNRFFSRNETQRCANCAFVIPTYEIDVNSPQNPKDKVELISLLKKRLAQRFHVKVFAPNQGNSNLKIWEEAGMTGTLQVQYNISSWAEYWEPIYVARDTVPPYDERFKGYGFTRNSQVLEMQMAGYRWQVLNDIFLTHRGFQTLYTDTVRRQQVQSNAVRYWIFKKELFVRYTKDETTYKLQNPTLNEVSQQKPEKLKEFEQW